MATLQLKGQYYRLYPAGNYLGYTEEDLVVDTREAAFVIVDVYGQFPEAHDGSSPAAQHGLEYMFSNEYDIIARRIRPAKDAAKRLGIPAIYTTNSAPRIALDRSEFGRQRAANVGQTLEQLFCEDNIDPLENVYGHSTYIKHAPIIAPEPDDYYVRKYVYSGFFDTRLDSLLRNLGARTLFFTGFSGDICLLCTMIDALYRNYRVALLRDCTQAVEIPGVDGPDYAFTRRMVLWAECYLGYTITSEQFVAACQRALEVGGTGG